MPDQHQSSNVFNPPERLLLGPGPSNIHPKVAQAMVAPMLGHLDPDFVAIMDDVQRMLRLVFKTQHGFTLPVSGTGTAGMEAALVNLLEPGDTIVVAVNGFFGGRLEDIASRIGARVERVEYEWGAVIDPQPLRDAVRRQDNVKMVGVVHAETSTGVLSPIEDMAAIAHERDALLLVDAVTSLGGCNLDMDAWELDVVYSGTQKCLGAPSGLAPLALSERAMDRLRNRQSKVSSFYLDLSILDQYWTEGGGRIYHHTAPITMIYALWQALDLILQEGLDARYERHRRAASALRAGLGGHWAGACRQEQLGPASDHGQHSGGHRGRRRSRADAPGTRHRNWRGIGCVQREGLANRPHGPQRQPRQRPARTIGAGTIAFGRGLRGSKGQKPGGSPDGPGQLAPSRTLQGLPE